MAYCRLAFQGVLFLCIVFCAFMLVLRTFRPSWSQLYSTPCPESCGSDEMQAASTTSLVPRLFLPLLNMTMRYMPSVARYLVAYMTWLRPLGILFLLPIAFVALLYFTALMVQLYCLRDWLIGGLKRTGRTDQESNLLTDELLRRLVAAVWEAHGRAFHAYEVVGMEKLPPPGEGTFLVYYHGTVPLDTYYFMARHVIKRNRMPVPVVDRFLFRLPGLQRILRLTCALEGSVEECVTLLNPILAECGKPRHCYTDKTVQEGGSRTTEDVDNPIGVDRNEEQQQQQQKGRAAEPTLSRPGEVLLLSPGGVREALFSDEYYSLLWGKRRGFARVAIKANRPIYPVFTENIREGIRVVQYGKRWLRRLYEITRLPLSLYYGYFPVKLRTYIGDPLYPREGETDEQLADRAREAIEDMILRYQWRPGNVVIALLQRIPCFDAWVQAKNAENYRSRHQKSA